MPDGSCMISTGQLDGERVLKPKYALEETQNDLAPLIQHDNGRFSVLCGPPNPDLFYFDGLAELGSGKGTREYKPVGLS